MADSLFYPFRVMRITQTYNGGTSHYGHSRGSPRDYPIDEAGADGGRDPMYAPCDLRIVRIWGVDGKGVNTLFCESVGRVRLANGKASAIAMQITHPNDDDLRTLRVGQRIEKGRVLCREGSDGASGSHIHLSVGCGRLQNGGWIKNSRGKWVLTATGGPLKPEEAFWIDPFFTRVLNDGGLPFCTLPQERCCRLFRVTAPLLNVRAGPGTQYAAKPFAALSANAQQQILALRGVKCNGYVRGVLFTARAVSGNWASTDSGWVCLDYCEACP